MSRASSDYDAPTADVVTRALRAVAEATPVASPGADLDLAGREAMVVSLSRSPGAQRPGRRHRVRTAIALTAAAALLLLTGVVWTGSDGETASRATDPTDPTAAAKLVPGWLPDDLPADDEPLFSVQDNGLRLDGALLRSPDGTAEVLAVVVEAPDGAPIREHVVSWVSGRLREVFGRVDAETALESSRSRGFVAIGRGSASGEDAEAVVARLKTGIPLTDLAGAPPGWTAQAVPVDWVPGIAPTHGARYVSGDEARNVEVATVAGELPDGDTLTALLADNRPTASPGRQGWLSTVLSTDEQMFLWQEAPGMIGTVVASGLSHDELLRVADGLRVVDWSEYDDVRIVAEGELGGGLSYSIQWADTLAGMGESPCVTLVIDGATVGHLCGFDHPGSTFSQIGPVVRDDDITLVWGVVGAGVQNVTSDDPTVPSVDALPLDPTDPDSMRYVLVPLQRSGHGKVTLTLLNPDDQPLHAFDIDVEGPLGG